jgi:hypothetical protein
MGAASDYETKLEALLQQCDVSIEEASACAREASGAARRACLEEMDILIVNRESLRRGLLRLEEPGCLCSSCPSSS